MKSICKILFQTQLLWLQGPYGHSPLQDSTQKARIVLQFENIQLIPLDERGGDGIKKQRERDGKREIEKKR